MRPEANPERYKNHRFLPAIISHALWLYFRFARSYRDVEEMLLARGMRVSYETIRKGRRKSGQDDANQIRWRRPRTGGKRHLDEVFLTMNGEPRYVDNALRQPVTRASCELSLRNMMQHSALRLFRVSCISCIRKEIL